ncbi:hypothetical protein ACFXNW_13535 [Nocardia sp. NPDC059180]|uniref:hypothetical protein n=1 Tax=Nocardia sp. NPDC059180 TaxID=3346761 RepID=UPI003698A0D0
MTSQLWLTAVVAIVGNLTLVANVILTSRNATKLAHRNQLISLQSARTAKLEDACHQFLVAARQVRSPVAGLRAEEKYSGLSELRSAVARIEMYGSGPAQDKVVAALTVLEKLAAARSSGSWSDSLAAAEADCDAALTDARGALAVEIGGHAVAAVSRA